MVVMLLASCLLTQIAVLLLRLLQVERRRWQLGPLLVRLRLLRDAAVAG